MKKVSVSFFNSNNIEEDIIKISSTDADYIHVDVGDGSFIEKRFNPIKELKKVDGIISKRLDVHFMVSEPEKYINEYCELNCEYMVFHCEVKKDILKLLELIKSYGIKCGLSISPDTDIYFLEPYLDDIDMILVMSVVPGKGGQKFLYSSVDRILEIKKLIGNRNIVISIDGGINEETVKLINSDIVVSGSFVLNSSDIEKSISLLR